MDMDTPAIAGAPVVVALHNALYQVVPLEYQTFCVLTAQICCRVLRHFGIEARVEPCQLWWVAPEQNYIVGFSGNKRDTQWEGHVVCRGEDFLIDAALYHVQRDLGVEVPRIVIAHIFGIPSNVISRYDLDHGTRLWWHRPPPDADLQIPDEPEEIIARYTDELISLLELNFSARGHVSAQLVPAEWQPVPAFR
jgi:hypothetical protein